jgi:hypothetical protein
MSLINDDGDSSRLVKYLTDAIPAGPHPEPHTEFVSVRLDAVQQAADHIEWLEKGIDEWQRMYNVAAKGRNQNAATMRIAVRHLHAVLNTARTHADQQKADIAAREWLISIGSEPS